ncbi:pleckstrin homology domain-containing family G member 5-like isoform X4 [Montipora foliosa]|uniref:pleckstrin homology domain-containing family G member 5-like isoform X4 n=1 Tax=Montipora foliosa TaxID=591990 RepID=UPI0035F1C5BD
MCFLEILLLRRILRGRDELEHYGKDGNRVCQGKLCASNLLTEKEDAVKVCHHEDCQDKNDDKPLLLCSRCDEVHHLGAFANHARFDLPERPSSVLYRTPSSHSAGSDSGNEDDVESEPNNKVDKKNRGYSSGKRMFRLNAAASKRKPRRHNTDDARRDFISIKFFDRKTGEFRMDMIPALSGKSLKDSIEPLFEAQDFSFSTHSVFLDSSNTPLPLAFDTFPLGGNVLHVRANEDFKVDQRIIDMARDSYEDKSVSEDVVQRPKSSSFMSRSGSFTAKNSKEKGGGVKKQESEEKGMENSKEEKSSQQFNKNTQRGKKSMEALFGKEFTVGFQPSSSSPVLPGGVFPNAGGTMPRSKPANGRRTGLFTPPKALKGTLKDSLERYLLYGLEENTSYDVEFKNEIDDVIKLESSWTEVVSDDHIKGMTKKQKNQQEAIWEMLTTEATYISTLHVIKKLFVQCLRNLQREGFLQEIEDSKLFSNIEDIYTVNMAFWMANLSKVVENARLTKDALNPLDMESGFNMFDSQFDAYITYCMEEANCLKYFKEKMTENEDFRMYILWCEEHPYCTGRLKLSDFLVKPMQRVTKYPLLVKAVYNKTLDSGVKEHLATMRDRVEAFVRKVNGAMRVRHELEKLKATADRIQNNYNVVEAVNEEMEKILQDYSSYDLMRPMPGLTNDEHRCVIHEGPLRLVEKAGKTDVHIFLFTDLLLITKAKRGDRFKVIKPPLQVDKISLTNSRDQGTFLLIYVNEYNIATQAFALQGTVNDETQWIEAIKKAQKLYMVAKLGQGPSHMMPVHSASDSDIVSPSSFLVSASGQSPAFPRNYRRKSSASSIIDDMSLDSESDEESGLAMMTLNPRVRSDSVQTSASSTQSFENKGKDSEAEEKEGGVRRKSQTDLMTPEEEKAQQVAATATLRSESLGKIARSPSAPENERPRVVDTSSLSRSSSAPQGPTPEHASSLREGIIMKRRAEEQEGSASSSSASLNDSAGDVSNDCPSLPKAEQQQTEPESMEQPSNSELDSSTEQDTLRFSSFMEDNEQEHCEPEEQLNKNSFDGSEESKEDPPEMPLSISDLFNTTSKGNESQKQTPHIKSQLLGQHQIQSPRKRISLPKRSSPVLSKKNRPHLTRAHGKSDSDLSGILQKIRDVALSADSRESSPSSSIQERSYKSGTNKRSSETFPRSPVKPDKSHYPAGLDLMVSQHKKDKGSSSSGSGSSLCSRKKSMSLSDLLSIGKDLTSNRNKEKDYKKDNNGPKPPEQLSPLSPLTDDDNLSPTDANENRKEEKRSRFRLRRKTSRTEIKDGIASGPNMDPRRASRHFFKESLMLESSVGSSLRQVGDHETASEA